MFEAKDLKRLVLGMVILALLSLMTFSLTAVGVSEKTWLGMPESWQYFFKVAPVFLLVALAALSVGMILGFLLVQKPKIAETNNGVAILADSTPKLILGLGASGFVLVAKKIVDYAEKFAGSVSLDPNATAISACATLIIFSLFGVVIGYGYQNRQSN